MTKARDLTDIKDMIQEHAASPVERKALEHVAEGLEDSLGRDAPARPVFKAQLRTRLMAEARKQRTPWYGRPVVVGSSLSLVAAVAVLAIGLQIYRPGAPGGRSAQPSGRPDASGVKSFQVRVVPKLTSRIPLPLVTVPDEAVPPEVTGPEPLAGVDPSLGLKLIQLTGHPDGQLLRDTATRLGLGDQVHTTAVGLAVTQGSQTLALSSDGHVVYTDSAAASAAGTPTEGVEGARIVARRFLTRAALPIADRLPSVSESGFEGIQHVYNVTFTQRVEGRPVVNARAVIRVTDFSGIVRADAYVQAGKEDAGTFEAVPLADAVNQAQDQGGAAFTSADLVWVRTVSGGAVYLQPYWRVFGADVQGARRVRYVAALSR